MKMTKPINQERSTSHEYNKYPEIQRTAIEDECTRIRYVYDFEEYTPENSVRFLKKLIKAFPCECSEEKIRFNY